VISKGGMTDVKARIKLRRILQASQDEVKDAMRDAANVMHREMVSRAPVDSGTLKSSITAYVAANGMRAEVGLRGKKAQRDVFYARFVELGTKSYNVSIQSRRVLSNGTEVFGTRMSHPGTPSKPFIQPTWDYTEPQVIFRVEKAIKNAVEQAQKL
jgi:HK97 gp10 family phage protein